MKCIGHMVKMKDERLPKRSETNKQGGCTKRGRPRGGGAFWVDQGSMLSLKLVPGCVWVYTDLWHSDRSA